MRAREIIRFFALVIYNRYNMDRLQKYKPSDKMIDLISDNYSLLQVMSRFGLSLGFGDKTVKEVCEMNGVDCRTFLVVVNFMAEGFSRMDGETDELSIPALVDYLRQAHIYFLDFCLPAIRRKLLEAIDCSENDVSFLILKFFDEYMREVRKHMEYEEKTVFKYVDALLQNNAPKNYQISTFSKHHDQVGEKLTELKNIIIKYCPAKANTNLLNAALFDIYACEEGLESHCKVEDYIFVPAILNLERRMMDHQISTFSKHHDQVGEKLTELKNIIIKYCPAKANTNLLNAALFDIYACEEGLESHCKVEDYIFVPAILNLERRMMDHEK